MVHVTNFENLLTYTIDSYGKGHRNGSLVLDAVGEGCGQAFTSPLTLARLTDAVFHLQRNAAFIAPGAIEARLYRVLAGTVVGTTAVPDIIGGVLATSDPVVAADIDTAWGLVNFHFGTPYTLDPELGYVMVVVVTNCPAGGQVEVGIDTTIPPLHFPTHAGNETNNITLPPAWTPNPLNDVIFYLFSFSDALAGGVIDVSDRWARQLGMIDLQRYLGVACGPANPIDVQGTGLNTNPERWLHENHWDMDEVNIAVIGVGGQQNLGAVVGAGLMRRIREITIRHTGTNNTVITILIAGGATRLTIDVPAQSTRVWTSQDGREFAATQQPAVQTSDVTGGGAFVSASGVEFAP